MKPAADPFFRAGEPPHDGARIPARNRPLRWLWDTFSFYLVLTLLAVCFSGWSLLAFPLSLALPRRMGQRLGQAAIKVFFRVFLATMRGLGIARYDLRALDTLRDARGVVFAANHLALLDILLLGSRLPRTVCIIKAGLWNNPLLGGGRLAGYIRNDEAMSLVRRSAKALRQGSNLLIFPEGTRQKRGQLGPFRPGFALIARQARAPVQPIFIESNSPYLSKGWPLWRRPAFPLMYRVTLGPRQHVEGRAEAFSEALRATFLARLQAP
jgi:1-acyl-sn-glycerol-3-phosphate acyltransferase